MSRHATPPGWVQAKVGDIARVIRGVTYRKADSSSTPQPDLVPILRATNIGAELDFNGLVYVPESAVSNDQYLEEGDSVVAASSGSLSVVGKAAPLRSPWRGSFGAFCFALRPAQTAVAAYYLAYALKTSAYRTAVARLAAGVNINNLKRGHFDEIDLSLAPLPEQHRIVEAIESYFTRLDDAVATLERVRRNLERYRASALKAAVEGRLVPTEAELAKAEGRAYEPASVLLERIRVERRRRWEEAELAKMRAKGKPPKDDRWKAKYKPPVEPDTSELPELPEGWCWTTVEALNPATRPCAYGVLQPGDHVEDGTPFVRVGDIGGGKISIEGMKRIAPDISARYPRTSLVGGEVLLTLVGTVGRTAVVPDALAGGNTARAVGVLPVMDGVNPHWVEVWFRNPAKIAEMTGKAHEVARKTLNLEDVRSARVALPPRSEQDRIVAEIDREASVLDETEAVMDTSLRRCGRLRQSILKWAFEGKLVDQDPDDEPVSALLERIKAEREAATSKPARKAPRRHK